MLIDSHLRLFEIKTKHYYNCFTTLEALPLGPKTAFHKRDIRRIGSIINFVELIYAIHSAGSINDGSACIKSLCDCFGEALGVDVKSIYKKYLDICSRKGDRTIFLDQLKAILIARMDGTEK